MTLQEWEDRYNGTVCQHDGATAVYLPSEGVARCALYHLADYKVSSVSGEVAWMVPVTNFDVWVCKKCGTKFYNIGDKKETTCCGESPLPSW
jgi:hypothetical protein